MPRLTIDGREIEAPAGQTVMEAATAAGIWDLTRGDSIGPVSKLVELVFEGVDRGEEPSPALLVVGHLRQRERR